VAFDQCSRFEPDTASFVLGDLPGDRRAEMVAHLGGCSPCRRDVDALNAALDSISAVTVPVPPSPGFVESVLAAAESTLAPAAVPALVNPALVSPARPRVTGVQRPVAVVMRRRRTLLGLSGATLLLAAIALGSASWAVSALAIFFAVLEVAYIGLVVALTHTKARDELAASLPVNECWWSELEPVGPAGPGPVPDMIATPVVAVDNMALVHFAASYFAGWVLTPVVALIGLVRGDLTGLEHSPVLTRIVALQRQGRAQSLRLLAAGATTVAVAGGGTVATMVVAPGVASAAAAPAHSAGARPDMTGRYGIYTVQSGDTLESIAARFGTTVASLAAANRISDPGLIVVGQVLTVNDGRAAP
jgi:hypothetical protein